MSPATRISGAGAVERGRGVDRGQLGLGEDGLLEDDRARDAVLDDPAVDHVGVVRVARGAVDLHGERDQVAARCLGGDGLGEAARVRGDGPLEDRVAVGLVVLAGEPVELVGVELLDAVAVADREGGTVGAQVERGTFPVFLIVVVWSAWFHLPRTVERPVAAAAAQSSAASSTMPTASAVRPDLSFCMGYTSLAAHWAPGLDPLGSCHRTGPGNPDGAPYAISVKLSGTDSTSGPLCQWPPRRGPNGEPPDTDRTRRGTNNRYESVRRRKVHHPQPGGHRGRPGRGDHRRAQRHRAGPPARRAAAPGGRYDAQPGHQVGRRRRDPRGRRRGGCAARFRAPPARPCRGRRPRPR